ncbi:ASCH/PUA domain-containing protein [Hymenobacter terricola]|uniref:ASCH/PUA domain-containing protein n=1 Tax=Hymenobacter terricola TaxID=2819236 RepID=UPI001B312254|nr:ASCH/PUA domain-containing protein [Hymenobacter terricola]
MTTNVTALPEQFIPQFHIADPAHRQTHELMTWPSCFAAVKAGNKPFDVREKDQNFQVGDVLLLREFDPEAGQYTGQNITRWVSYVLEGGLFGVQPNWCVLGFSDIPPIPSGITDIRLW